MLVNNILDKICCQKFKYYKTCKGCRECYQYDNNALYWCDNCKKYKKPSYVWNSCNRIYEDCEYYLKYVKKINNCFILKWLECEKQKPTQLDKLTKDFAITFKNLYYSWEQELCVLMRHIKWKIKATSINRIFFQWIK